MIPSVLFIHFNLVNKYLSAFYVLGTVLGTGHKAVNKKGQVDGVMELLF